MKVIHACLLCVCLVIGAGCTSMRPGDCGCGDYSDPARKEKKGAKTLFTWAIGPNEVDKKDKNGKDDGEKEAKENGKEDKENGKDDPDKKNGNGAGNGDGTGDKPEEPEESDEIVTDRPDFTEASSTVGAGRVQLEAGYTYSRNREAGIQHSHSYPEALLRIGMFADWFELRLGQNFSNTRPTEPDNGASAQGAEDLYFGVKLGLTEQKKYLPEAALVLQATAPTGADALTSKKVLPGMNLLYGWDVIEDCLSLAGSTQGNAAIDDDDHSYLLLAQSATVGYSLTKKLGAYTEFFALFPHGAIATDTGPEYYFNGGFTYKFTPNFQYDVRGGVGLNRQAEDFFVGSGFAVRY